MEGRPLRADLVELDLEQALGRLLALIGRQVRLTVTPTSPRIEVSGISLTASGVLADARVLEGQSDPRDEWFVLRLEPGDVRATVRSRDFMRAVVVTSVDGEPDDGMLIQSRSGLNLSVGPDPLARQLGREPAG